MILEVLKCSKHGFLCVAVNDRRVTPGKCCGQWDLSIRKWKIDGRTFAADVRKAFKP